MMNKNTAYMKKAKKAPGKAKNNKQNRAVKKKNTVRRISSIRISKPVSKLITNEASYIQSLLAPECSHQSKIPGQATATISLKRHITSTMQANNLGCLGIMWQPNHLFDNASSVNYTGLLVSGNNLDPLAVRNNTFDGVSTQGAFGPVGDKLTVSVTPGVINQSRLVSASMHVVPQASMLNQQGTIHGALLTSAVISNTAPGTAYPAYSDRSLISAFQNSPYYKEATISAQEGIRIIYLPDDGCLLDFYGMNSWILSANETNQLPTLFATVAGAAANANFRVDFFLNYEVTATPGSVIQGMESICSENTVATTVWRDVVSTHSSSIVTVSRSLSNIPEVVYAAAALAGGAKKGPNFRTPKLYN